MLNYIWPIALVVLSNVIYHICAKSVPEGLDPFAALSVTYIVGAIVSVILYFIFNKNGNLIHEGKQLNWAPIVLGIVIVGLEVGTIYAYKAGWQISTENIVQGSALAILLIAVGCLFYKESLNWNKIVGIVVCIIGIVFINLK